MRAAWIVAGALVCGAVPSSVSAQRIVATVGSPDPTVAGASVLDTFDASIGADAFIAYLAESLIASNEERVLLGDEAGRPLALVGPSTTVGGRPLGRLAPGVEVAGTLVLFSDGAGSYATWDSARGVTRMLAPDTTLPDGSTVTEVQSIEVNPSSELLLVATSSSTLSGAYLRDADGTIRNVLRSGQSAPSHPEINLRRVVAADLEDDGDVVVLVDAVVPGAGPGDPAVEHQFLLAGRVAALTTLVATPDLPGYDRHVSLLGLSPAGHVAYVTQTIATADDTRTQTLYVGSPGSATAVSSLVGDASIDLGDGYTLTDLDSVRTRGAAVRVAGLGEVAMEASVLHGGAEVGAVVAFHEGQWSLVAAADQSLPEGDGPAPITLRGLSPSGEVVVQTPAAVYRHTPGAAALEVLVSVNDMLDVGGGDVRAPQGVGTSEQPIADDGTVVYRATWLDDTGVTRGTIFATDEAVPMGTSDLEIVSVDAVYSITSDRDLTDLQLAVRVRNRGPDAARFTLVLESPAFTLTTASCPIVGSTVACAPAEAIASGMEAVVAVMADVDVTIAAVTTLTVEPLGTTDPVLANNTYTYIPEPPDTSGVATRAPLARRDRDGAGASWRSHRSRCARDGDHAAVRTARAELRSAIDAR